MKTKFQTYPKYKPSGIDWLGDVPTNWGTRRNLGLFSERKEHVKNFTDEEFELLSVTIGQGVVRQAELAEIEERKDSSNEDKGNYKWVRKGDIAYNKMRMWQGAAGESKYEGIVSPAYIILKPKAGVLSKYLHYLFRTEMFNEVAYQYGHGIADDQHSLRYWQFKALYSPLPPLETQKQIADFLDEKTKIIDELVAKKGKLIELLREKRAALITRAVTKGLNPNAKLKSSDVDWLGDIPEEWEVRKVKYLISRNDGGVWGDADDSEGTPVLRSTEVSIVGRWRIDEFELAHRALTADEINKGELVEGDLVVTKSSGSEEHIGKTALVDQKIAEKGYCYSNFMQRLRPKRITNPKLLYYFLNSQSAREQYKYLSNSTIGLGNLNAEMLNSLYFLLIPEEEQKQIADFLDAETEGIDKAVKLIESQIEKFKEYRSSLIYHAVTGKIKI